MKKTILVWLICCVLSSTSYARPRQWVRLADDGSEIVYVDHNSEKGNHLTVMFDYSNGGSTIMDYEVVCESKFRILASADFSKQLGSGKVLRTDTKPSNWYDVDDASLPTVVQTIILRACTKYEEGH